MGQTPAKVAAVVAMVTLVEAVRTVLTGVLLKVGSER